MNTRIQVEHPVTEEVTGLDLVQDAVARRRRRAAAASRRTTAVLRGHAIECRINAEDPARGFRPARVACVRYRAPTGRACASISGVEEGYAIPGAYDSMIAKLSRVGATASEARLRMLRALDEFAIARRADDHPASPAGPAAPVVHRRADVATA